jgi:catechol 2,3-dioxygenase-like lactoylglutathione lyase family enzyme
VLDHLSLGVTDLERAIRFYDAALGALGLLRVWTYEHAAGYDPTGPDEKLAIIADPQARPAGAGAHLALTARDRAAVDAFHRAALANGGTDEGAPGLRPRYGSGYYAAFVRDPDGNKLEAVHHGPVDQPGG